MTNSAPALLGPMMTGFWVSQSIYVAAKLGLADLLADGPQTAEELADATGTNAAALYRLLRALASVSIFREDEQHRFAMTPTAEPLRSDVDRLAAPHGHHDGRRALQKLDRAALHGPHGPVRVQESLRQPVFDWMSRHPEQAALFDQAMVSVHGRETSAMIEAYDFSSIGVLADVGGGNGSVLRGVLAAHPQMRGMLCDLSGVIERSRPAIAAAGFADRMRLIPTNFFEEVPAGAEAYLMRHIIHDWDDQESLQILRNVRRAVTPEGRLLVVEGVIPPGNDPNFTKLLDLNMMVIPGGKERTEVEYRELFQAAGFRLTSITPTQTDVSVIEGRPA